MTTPQRSYLPILLVIVGVIALAAAGLGFLKWQQGVYDREQVVLKARKELAVEEKKLLDLRKAPPQPEAWRVELMRKTEELKPLSLHDDSRQTNSYEAFLRHLLKESELVLTRQALSAQMSQVGILKLWRYSLDTEGKLPQLHAFLREFYSVNIPHHIRTLSVERDAKENGATETDPKLKIKLEIEVLSLPGAPKRSFLPAVPDYSILGLESVATWLQLPIGTAFAGWCLTPQGFYGSQRLAGKVIPERDYGDLTSKKFNLFAGRFPPPMPVAQVTPEAPPTVPEAPKPVPDEETLHLVELSKICWHDTQIPWQVDEALVAGVKIAGIWGSPLESSPLLTTGLVLAEPIRPVELAFRNLRTGEYHAIPSESGSFQFQVRDAKGLLLRDVTVCFGEKREGVVVIAVNGSYFKLRVGDNLGKLLNNKTETRRSEEVGF
jgi:hypothetical protein